MKNLFILILLIAPFATHAQSLPNVQKISVRAPANIKIDGKAAEWDNKLQAYNKATDVYYTLSNDDENIYLTIQAKYHDVVDKIIRGGITLTINHTLAKKDEAAVSVTYPVLRDADMASVANMVVRKTYPQRNGDTSTVIKVDDLNQLLDGKSKTINIAGIKAIADEAISVYNSDGIKAVSRFDNQIVYTYELAIPLKYLALPNNGVDGFSYHIKINAPAESHAGPHNGPPAPPMMVSSSATTDFWGEYTLAKK